MRGSTVYKLIKGSPILIAIVSGISGDGTERLSIAVEHLRVEHMLQREV